MADQALITWLIMQGSRGFHALITWLIIHWSCDWSWELDYKESREQKNLWFWTVGLERTLRVHWTKTRWNQSILKQINPECSLEGLMLNVQYFAEVLKLKVQYFGHLIQRADSLEKTLMLGKTEGERRRGQQRMKWLDGFINSIHQAKI